MLAIVLTGGSPVGGSCRVATVGISGGGKGDQPVGSPEVKVRGGWESQSDPSRRTSNSTGRSESANQETSKSGSYRKRMVGLWECRAVGALAKASVVGEGTGRMQPTNSPGS